MARAEVVVNAEAVEVVVVEVVEEVVEEGSEVEGVAVVAAAEGSSTEFISHYNNILPTGVRMHRFKSVARCQ